MTLLAALLLGAAPAGAEPAVTVTAEPITRFHIGSQETRFGALEFIGGLVLDSDHPEFGAISGFRFLAGDGRFLAVTDTGFWLSGRLMRTDDGRPAGLADVSIVEMTDSGGRGSHKRRYDAESLEIRDGNAIVGFEQEHRIVIHALRDGAVPVETGRIDPLIPLDRLRSNAGFEALAAAPVDSALGGALVAITERSTDANGNLFAAILEGPQKGIFKVVRRNGYDVTDSVFLPGGDLVVLERSFGLTTGVRMRMRRIAGDALRAGALVDGPTLIEADLRHQIDNMEAIDAWRGADGRVRIAVLSDDNQSLLQRSLYLEFRLADDR